MRITCPSCSTSYDVDGSVFGDQDRPVRCTNCGHQWLQARIADPAVQPAPPPPPVYWVPYPPAYAPGSGYGPPPGYPPQPYPPPYPYPWQPPPPEAAAAAEPAPAAEPEPMPPGEPPSDEEPEAMPGPEWEPGQEPEEEIEGWSDPEPLDPFMDDAEEFDEDIEPGDFPDPELISELFSPPVAVAGEQETGRRGLWVSLAAVGAVVIVLVGLVFARGPIVSLVPGLAGAYALVGLAETLGDGLRIDLGPPTREAEGDEKWIQVEGTITNVSDGPRTVPVIRISLADAAGNEVRHVNILPAKDELAPEESLEFTGRIDNPPPTARRADVGFTDEGAPAR